jgi:hypothetical protein
MKKLITCIALLLMSIPGFCQIEDNYPGISNPGYYAIAPYQINAYFPAFAKPVSKYEDKEFNYITYYAKGGFGQPGYTDPNYRYTITIIDPKKPFKRSDSLKELNSIYVKMTEKALEYSSAKKISSKKSSFRGRACYYFTYKAKEVSAELNDTLVLSNLFFYYDSVIVRASVSTRIKNKGNPEIKQFFKSINFGPIVVDNQEIFSEVPVMPLFGKKTEGFNAFIKSKLSYPTTIEKTPTSKRVYVYLIIEKTGKATLQRAEGIDEKSRKELEYIIQAMPAWTPGKLSNNTPVRVLLRLPIWFE